MASLRSSLYDSHVSFYCTEQKFHFKYVIAIL